ncbi:MAG: LamG domain-containing protein [Sedimentisphaerales bacterium]
MLKKLICLISFVLLLGLAGSASAELVMYWPLDEGSGATAVDVSGNGNDGAITGTSNWVAGMNGLALDFDGTSTSIELDHEVVRGTWSVAMWLKPRDIPYASGFYAVWHNNGWTGGTMHLHLRASTSLLNADFNTGPDVTSTTVLEENEWYHAVVTVTDEGAGASTMYINGLLEAEGSGGSGGDFMGPGIFGTWSDGARYYHGLLDDIRIYDHVLSEIEVLGAMEGKVWPYASAPTPEDGALHSDTWVSLSWRAGGVAASHDVYLGESFDDVNNGTGDTFRGNLGLDTTFYIAGFPGYAYPDGLVNGTTYYWKIDEVNEADPNSPWKGDVWSFMVPPKTAYEPVPAEGTESVALNVTLTWTPGFNAKLHYIVFGEDFDEVNDTATGKPNGPATYSPGSLKLAKTYYWRIDEFDGAATHKGEVWSFTTLGAVSGPNPANGAVDVKPTVILGWNAGAIAASHEVYFGADADAVKNATTASPEYKGAKALGEESYDPGMLTLNTAYFWRIDEVNGVNPDSPWAGNVWSFSTGDFFVIDDFEIYDANDNQLWYSWHDGLGYGAPGTPDYFAGNGTGAAVGDETTPSYTEETIVQGGSKSMPVSYDNNKQGFSKYSEVELTLDAVRDWTAEGVVELSLWFRGYAGSVGSFVEGPAGTFTMTGAGADIWNNGPGAGEYHDEFHFAYKMLTGPGSIVAKVESVQNTNVWAKAGVMIRETLEGGSKHAFSCVTPGSGVSFQSRPDTGAASANFNQGVFTAPYWVKLERDIAGNFSAYHSANGSSWQLIEEGAARNIPMTSNVYIGLALTSHEAAITCEAVFSNVTTTGSVSGQWANQDIGISSNDAEPLYVAVSNTAGQPAVVVHDDPAATTIDTWTEWIIPLQAFADQGIVLTNVDRIAIGQGTKGNMATPGGSGKMFFDDIRLYGPREAAGE